MRERAARNGRVRVLVEVSLPAGHVPEGQLDLPVRLAQRQQINAQQARVLARLSPTGHRILHRYQTIPWVALEADAAALAALESIGADIVRVADDALARPVLSKSVPLVQGDQAWGVGFDGAGTTIAVLDTGVDASHPFLANKVIEEACFSGGDGLSTTSFCPNGQPQQIGPGSATECWLDGCYHGTHVAGIAAGNGASAGVPFSGVAKNAHIMAVQVFSEVHDFVSCGSFGPCLGGFTSDIIAGLERVYTVAPQLHVAAVNLSLGEGQFDATCDSQPYKSIIDNLRSIGVATVAAAGNEGFTDSLITPACVSTAISVGATSRDDGVLYFSNVAPFLSLFAPGDEIVSAVPGGDFAPLSGTSMAAPHVAGAFAILRQALPAATVTTLLNALRHTGRPVADTRGDTGTTVPRINIFEALASLTTISNPVPVLTSISPVRARKGDPPLTLTVSGSGFDAFSVVRWNGADRPSKVISSTAITATIPATDLAAAASADVTVFTPVPVGGLSTSATFTIDPPPTLTISAATVSAGGSETVTLHDGFGGQGDWITLAVSGSADTSYLQWTYVGAGVTMRAWTLTMPSTPGTYEFRFFRDYGYSRAATSPVVTIEAPPPPELTVNTTSVTAGGSATVTLVNGPGGSRDWITVAASASADTSYLQWTYVGAGVTTRTWTVNLPSTPGSYQFRLFLNGVFTRAATSPNVTVTPGPPAVTTLSPTSVMAGSTPVALTVYGTSFLPTSIVRWNGSDRPTTFVSATELRAAISAADLATAGTALVAVFSPPPGGGISSPSLTFTIKPAPSLVVSTPSAAGGTPVTVTLSNGFGGSGDWLALAAVGAADTSYLQWTYVGASVTTRTWTVTMPPAGGIFEFRLFLNAGYTRAATSPTVAVVAGPAATLSVNATSVSGGAPVTVTLAGGAGGASDWIAFAATTAANTAFVQWTYVGAGVTTRTWTVNVPLVAGTYEFRLFPNGGYTRAATSPTVTVIADPPLLTLNATSVVAGTSIAVTLTKGLGGARDWLALAAVGAPDTTYSRWTYVGAGVTARTWIVTVPTTPGQYEIRLFLNGGYTRAATSPAFAVTAP